MLELVFFLLRWFFLVALFVVLGTLALRVLFVRHDTDKPMLLDDRSQAVPLTEVNQDETAIEAADRIVGLPFRRLIHSLLARPWMRVVAIAAVLGLGVLAYFLTWG